MTIIKKILLWLGIFFFSFHVLAISVTHIPEHKSVINTIRLMVEPYLYLTGNWQDYRIFHTRPNYHKLTADVVVTRNDGSEEVFGALLPDFQTYRSDLRIFLTFLRFDSGIKFYPPMIAAYEQRICHALKAKNILDFRYFEIRLSTQDFFPIDAIRKNGIVGTQRTKRWPKRYCNG